jgi:undecaprenyl-diphosphatase
VVVELAKAEIALVAAVLGGGALLLGFVVLADAVLEGQTAKLDDAVLLALRMKGDVSDPIGPVWLEETARDLTALGSTSVILIIVGASAGYLLLLAKRRAALLLLVCVLGGMLLNHMLKFAFARPRPEIVAPLAQVFSASFPSGHAAASAAAYLTLAALLARTALHTKQTKLFFVGLAVFLTFIVGVTRVYLGLHYPTDVAAGWCIGAAWAMFCWAAALYLQRRGDVERP